MLLDSVIVIDYLNGIRKARDFVDRLPTPTLSVVTVAEVLSGGDPAGLPTISRYLNSFPILEVNVAIGRRAGYMRRLERWKLPDTLQAATAQEYGIPLATRNTKDFKPERHPFVLVPYVL